MFLATLILRVYISMGKQANTQYILKLFFIQLINHSILVVESKPDNLNMKKKKKTSRGW